MNAVNFLQASLPMYLYVYPYTIMNTNTTSG